MQTQNVNQSRKQTLRNLKKKIYIYLKKYIYKKYIYENIYEKTNGR